LRSTYQNDQKTYKIIIFNKQKFKFKETHFNHVFKNSLDIFLIFSFQAEKKLPQDANPARVDAALNLNAFF
jgi:hypothetical protein